MTTLPPHATTASRRDAAQRGQGELPVAAAAVLWSSGGLIVRSLEYADTWTTVFWRSVFGAAFLIVLIVYRQRSRAFRVFRAMGAPGVVVEVCFAMASTCLVIALELTSVANTLIIMSTSPLIAALIGRVVLGERVRAWTWLAMALALTGVAIMVSDPVSHGAIEGDLAALVMTVALAVAIVTIRRRREIGMIPASAFGTALAALVALPSATPSGASDADLSLPFVFGACQLGSGLALFTTGARLAPAAAVVALIALLEPILGPLWVWIFIGEHPGAAGLIGGSVVLAGLATHIAADLHWRRSVAPLIWTRHDHEGDGTEIAVL